MPHLLALAPQLLRPCGPVWSGLLPFVEPHAMGFGVWLPSQSAVLESTHGVGCAAAAAFIFMAE